MSSQCKKKFHEKARKRLQSLVPFSPPYSSHTAPTSLEMFLDQRREESAKSSKSSFSSVYYSKRWRLNFDDSILSLGEIGSGVVNHFPWDLKFNQQSLKSAFLDQRRWRDREHYHFCSCGGRISSHRSPFSYQKRIW